MGADGFGKLVFAQAIFLHFMLISDLGLQILGTRKIARENSKIMEYVSNILGLRLVLVIFSFFLISTLAYFIPGSLDMKYLILLYGIALFPMAFLLEWPFQGTEEMHYIGIGRILKSFLYAGLVFLLIKKQQQLLEVPVFNFFAIFVSAVFMYFCFSKKYGKIRFSFDILIWKKYLKASLPMGLSFIMTTIYCQMDTVMLGFMKNTEVVGWYNAGYKIVFFFIAFGPLFGITILPTISRYYKESPKKLRSFLIRSAKLTSFIGLIFAVGGTLFGKQIMNLIYGPEYSEGVLAFQILIWSVFTIYTNVPFAFSLLGCDKQKEYMYSSTTGAVINLGLNFYLIPKYSLIGAAVATIITEIVVLTMLYTYSHKTILSLR